MKRILGPMTLALLVLTPSFALTHPHPPKDAWRPDTRLGWAIHRDGQWHVSEIWDIDSADDLSSKYGDDFLYIRDGEERYVITDPTMIERATRATTRIKDHTKEISALANVTAELAMSRVHGTWERQRLESRVAALESRIQRIESLEDARQLKRDLKRVRDELHRLGRNGGETLTETERRDLMARRDAASDDLEEVIDGIRTEVREILREAKDRGLAKRVR